MRTLISILLAVLALSAFGCDKRVREAGLRHLELPALASADPR